MSKLDDSVLSASYAIRDEIESRASSSSERLLPETTLGLPAGAALLWRGIRSSDGGSIEARRAGEVLGADQALCLAFHTTAPCLVSGSIELEHTADLRPGLRCSVLIDDRVVSAPMVEATPWEGTGEAITGPAPEVTGSKPAGSVPIDETYLVPGRHWFWIVSPHDREAGRIGGITLKAGPPEQPPRISFAMVSDVHLTRGAGSEWMNLKMGSWTTRILRDTLATLRAEGMAFLLFGGDLTDRSRPEEFEDFARLCEGLDRPAFACLGNHDLYDRETASRSIRGALRPLFPGGSSAYGVGMEHLELVVLDSERLGRAPGAGEPVARGPEGAADPRPTIVLRHYPLRNHGGVSSAGFKLQDWSTPAIGGELPGKRGNRLFLAGHCHWTESALLDGDWYVQNPAFCEWPNAYRVFHVFERAIAWELRQVRNRAYVAHSFIPAKHQSWMLSTVPHDLSGRMRPGT